MHSKPPVEPSFMRKRCIGERSFLFRAKRRKYRVRDREGGRRRVPPLGCQPVLHLATHTHTQGWTSSRLAPSIAVWWWLTLLWRHTKQLAQSVAPQSHYRRQKSSVSSHHRIFGERVAAATLERAIKPRGWSCIFGRVRDGRIAGEDRGRSVLTFRASGLPG